MQRFVRHRLFVLTSLLGLMSLIAACAPEDAAPEEPAVEPDEPPDEDPEEVADIPETELSVQMLYGPEHVLSVAFHEFAEAVEEQSQGNITFDMHYAGALVPIDQLEDGLQAGLVDIALHIPIYSPEGLPVSNLLSDMAFLGEVSPVVGTLGSAGAYMEYGIDEAHWQEMLDYGIQPLTGLLVLAPAFHILCADDPVRTLQETSGKRTRVSGPGFAAEAEALGMTPVHLVGGEIYEGLQRGVVDCVIGNITDARDMGLLELGDHWTIDSEVAFSGWSSTVLSISQTTWDGLPVGAQRILWDNAGELFVRHALHGVFEAHVAAIEEGQEGDVEFHEWDDDAREALATHQESVIQEAADRADALTGDGQTYVETFVELQEEWTERVLELGYSDEEHPTWNEFAELQPEGEVDLDPFSDVLVQEVLSQRRP